MKKSIKKVMAAKARPKKTIQEQDHDEMMILPNPSPCAAFGSRLPTLAFKPRRSRWITSKPPFVSCQLPSRLDTLLYSSTAINEPITPYSPNLPYEILPLQTVVEILGDSSDDHLNTGLSNQQAEKVRLEVGPNSLPAKQKTSVWELWLQQFDDGLVKILVGVAIFSAAFSASEAWDVLLGSTDVSNGALSVFLSNKEIRSNVLQSFVEPGIIIAILLLNAAVGAWQDLSARSSLEALEKMQPRLATVLRDSSWMNDYDAKLLVPGDIIKLRVGDSIPADARLIKLSSSTMYVDESSLTGESVSVGKLSGDEGLVGINNTFDITSSNDSKIETIPIQDQSAMLFSGSLVTRGSGIAMIVRTGVNTQIGKIQSTLFEAQNETDERKTPLGEQLDRFGTKLSYIIGFICVVVWLTSIPRFSDSAFETWWEGALYYAKVSVALGVAAIPEGLPAVITLCLSLGTRRMAERNVIVRKLPSVEVSRYKECHVLLMFKLNICYRLWDALV
jgi:Ca2+-transporting ATPase